MNRRVALAWALLIVGLCGIAGFIVGRTLDVLVIQRLLS